MTESSGPAVPLEEFSSQYTTQGGVSAFLIKGYYQALGGLLRDLPPERLTSALEIGCGEGYSTERLLTILPTGTHLEASEYMDWQIPLAQRRLPQTRIIQEDIYSMQRSDDTFDIIFCLEVMEHLTDVRRALRELHRVAKRYVLIGVPNEPLWRILNVARGKYWRSLGNTPGHLNHWSAGSLSALVRQNSYRVINIRRPLPWILILAEKNREAASH